MNPHAQIARSSPSRRPERPLDFETIDGRAVCLDLARNWPCLRTETNGRDATRFFVFSVGGVHQVSRGTYVRVLERLKEEDTNA